MAVSDHDVTPIQSYFGALPPGCMGSSHWLAVVWLTWGEGDNGARFHASAELNRDSMAASLEAGGATSLQRQA